MTNGTWILPRNDHHAALLHEIAATVRGHGGQAFVFRADALGPDEHAAVLQKFLGDRAREYDELAEQASALIAELDRESRLEKFTFAELEEVEGEMQKLASWLDKIRTRDFFPGHRLKEAESLLARCRAALSLFSATVYAREGVTDENAHE